MDKIDHIPFKWAEFLWDDDQDDHVLIYVICQTCCLLPWTRVAQSCVFLILYIADCFKMLLGKCSQGASVEIVLPDISPSLL